MSHNLTIKETTHPIKFITTKNRFEYTASVAIDSSKYDIRYGSKSFFDGLGDKMIYDEFMLDVNLVIDTEMRAAL